MFFYTFFTIFLDYIYGGNACLTAIYSLMPNYRGENRTQCTKAMVNRRDRKPVPPTGRNGSLGYARDDRGD